jgi:hypothetical protein
LAELPFVRLGEKTKITGDSYDESVKAGQDAINSAVFPLDVEVKLSQRLLIIGDKKITMQPNQLALYATILKLKKDCKKKNCENCADCSITRVEWDSKRVKTFKSLYQKMRPLSDDVKWIKEQNGRFIVYNETLTQKISKINTTLTKNINNNALCQYYLIKPEGSYGNTYYVIELDKKKVKGIE